MSLSKVLFFNPCHDELIFRKHEYIYLWYVLKIIRNAIFAFPMFLNTEMISDDTGSWNPSSQSSRTQFFCIFNTMANDVLAILSPLAHWGRGKMAAVSQTKIWNAFSWIKMYESLSQFHWSLLLMFQLTIFHHWFRKWLGADRVTSQYLNQWWLY